MFRSLVYLPSRLEKNYKITEEYRDRVKEIEFRTLGDSTLLVSYWIECGLGAKKAPTILYLQGNQGNIRDRVPLALKLQYKLGVNVLLLGYRGYGKSQGSPSESGLLDDTKSAVHYLQSVLEIETDKKLFILGCSIGGAIGINLALHNHEQIRGMILENTFTSLKAMAKILAPKLASFTWLIGDRFNSHESMELLMKKTQGKFPVCIVVSLEDEMIPPEHSVILYSLCGSEGHFYTFPKGKHCDACLQPGYFEYLDSFLSMYKI